MADVLTIAMAQLNPVVGDPRGNADRLLDAWRAASADGADIVVASEMYLSGYPPEDLVVRRAFQDSIAEQVGRVVEATAGGGADVVVGAPWIVDGGLCNAALAVGGGRLIAAYRKQELPNYGVFDEKRVFTPGPPSGPVHLKGARLGLLVCEDGWVPGPAAALSAAGADILVVLNGSPFDVAKIADRERAASARTAETGLPLLYVNQVGGQDELVFDGTSFAVSAAGELVARASSWRIETVPIHLHRESGAWRASQAQVRPVAGEVEMTYSALVLGLRDYAAKNGFERIVLGVSGGIDSSVSAVVAADAIGAENVRCVLLPSDYTSAASVADAVECCRRLGAQSSLLPIQDAVASFNAVLKDTFAGRSADATEENIQARARAVILMALSNKFGDMLLTTGNKSEMSVGYATLYGDMSGGFSVLKDVYKTQVYELARWRNRRVPANGLGPGGEVIPASVLKKAPTAELRPRQTDQDTLPPYDELDVVLRALVEEEHPADEVVRLGHTPEVVARIEHMIYAAEYKRRQAPPGVRISRRHFGRDRRYPITNGFRERAGL